MGSSYRSRYRSLDGNGYVRAGDDSELEGVGSGHRCGVCAVCWWRALSHADIIQGVVGLGLGVVYLSICLALGIRVLRVLS